MQMAFDVFKRHGSIVDQNPDCKRQAAKCHDVDRFTKQMQHNQRGKNRERNRNGNNDSAAPIA